MIYVRLNQEIVIIFSFHLHHTPSQKNKYKTSTKIVNKKNQSIASVKVITANQSRISKITNGIKKIILRVCAYCRVSTDSEEQQTSYKSQKIHYENLIKEHDDY